eukprot:626142_1
MTLSLVLILSTFTIIEMIRAESWEAKHVEGHPERVFFKYGDHIQQPSSLHTYLEKNDVIELRRPDIRPGKADEAICWEFADDSEARAAAGSTVSYVWFHVGCKSPFSRKTVKKTDHELEVMIDYFAFYPDQIDFEESTENPKLVMNSIFGQK